MNLSHVLPVKKQECREKVLNDTAFPKTAVHFCCLKWLHFSAKKPLAESWVVLGLVANMNGDYPLSLAENLRAYIYFFLPLVQHK